jgi:hypothetical protein
LIIGIVFLQRLPRVLELDPTGAAPPVLEQKSSAFFSVSPCDGDTDYAVEAGSDQRDACGHGVIGSIAPKNVRILPSQDVALRQVGKDIYSVGLFSCAVRRAASGPGSYRQYS